MPDLFNSDFISHGVESPPRYAASVTPSDSTDLPYVSRQLYIGTEGDLALITDGGDTVTYVNHPVGYKVIRASRVLATGTTASDIISEW